jgi:hypothetical protein
MESEFYSLMHWYRHVKKLNPQILIHAWEESKDHPILQLTVLLVAAWNAKRMDWTYDPPFIVEGDIADIREECDKWFGIGGNITTEQFLWRVLEKKKIKLNFIP